MEKQIKSSISTLETAHKKVKETLAEFPEIVAQLDAQFTKQVNFLKVKVGLAQPEAEVGGIGKVTTLRGQKIEDVVKDKPATPSEQKVNLKEIKEKAADNEAEELKRQVDALEPLFLKIENDKLIDEHPDLVLRGVAKRAGLPVTEDTPEKIDSKYVQSIKDAIVAKQKLKDKE
ncbi:MAG: hypothetical protein LC112_13955 [Flavobacteriales bacterium]|nr:hypothetical protein [Flavobacteriales bacterium]